MIQITDQLAQARQRASQALHKAGRPPDDLMIVAVSKQQSSDAIRAARAAGLTHFGESYAQEAIIKQDSLDRSDITWHFIGKIQSNKTRVVAERFDWVHSLDRLRIAERLNDQRPDRHDPLNVLIQVNVANEPQKSGLPIDEVGEFARLVAKLPRLSLRGLMTVPPFHGSDSQRRHHYTAVRDLDIQLLESGLRLDTLSMGMSQDFEIAIACGSNCIRIGTALFGPRTPLSSHG